MKFTILQSTRFIESRLKHFKVFNGQNIKQIEATKGQ